MYTNPENHLDNSFGISSDESLSDGDSPELRESLSKEVKIRSSPSYPERETWQYAASDHRNHRKC